MSVSMTKKERIVGWIFLAAMLLLIPLLISTASQFLHWELDDAELNFIMFFVDFALTILIFRKYLWQSMKTALRHIWLSLRWAGIGLIVYYGCAFLLGLLFTWIAPDFVNANDSSIGQMAGDHYTLMAIGTVFLVPVTEETLYRGLIFGSLQKKNTALAYVISALAFSAIHVVGYIGVLSPWHLVLSLVQYLPGGIVLALACHKGDSVWASILLHMAINQIGISSMR